MFEQSRTQKSEASRELEAFRASRGQQPLGERYLGNQNQENQDQQLRRAPRSKVQGDPNKMNKVTYRVSQKTWSKVRTGCPN